MALYNIDQEYFTRIWNSVVLQGCNSDVAQLEDLERLLDQIQNNILRKIRKLDLSVDEAVLRSGTALCEWAAECRDADKKKLRVLHVLGVPYDKTGSGMVACNITSEQGKCGDEWKLCCADYEPSGKENIETILFTAGQGDPLDGAVSFPVPTYSKGMPFTHIRYSEMSELQLVEFCEKYHAFLKNVIETYKPDIINTNHLFLLNPIVEIIAPWVPVVCTTHGTEEKMLRDHPEMKGLVTKGALKVDKVFCVSDSLKKEVQEIYGVAPDRVALTENGFDGLLFQPRELSRKDVLAKYGISDEFDKIVLYAGKYSEWKGIEFLIEAAARNNAGSGRKVLTLIAGGGSRELYDKYRGIVSGHSAGNYIKFIELYGNRQTEISELMNISDVFVLPSFSEPFGMVLLEAMACGMRVVAADRGGPPMFVGKDLIDKGLAKLVRPVKLDDRGNADIRDLDNYVSALSEGVLDVINTPENPGERDMISKSVGQRRWEAVYRKIREEYKDAIERRMNRYLMVPLDSAFSGIVELCGGKALGLNRINDLRMEGFNVPGGQVITTLAFRHFIGSNDALKTKVLMLDKISKDLCDISGQDERGGRASVLREELARLSGEIRDAVFESELPADIKKAIKDYYSVSGKKLFAVRSSAVDEDTEDDAAAGRYHTELNVVSCEKMEEALKTVWASFFSDNAVAIRNEKRNGAIKKNENPDRYLNSGARMAVILQEMVNSEASGISYNVNVENGLEEIVIEAVKGYGDDFASGDITPDFWRFKYDKREERPVLLEEIIRGKPYLREKSTRDEPALTRTRAALLSGVLQKIADRFKEVHGIQYLDFEFTFDEAGKLYILQARPLTVVPYSVFNPVCDGVKREAAEDVPYVELNGVAGYPGVASGRLVIVDNPGDFPSYVNLEEASRLIKEGDILCTPTVNVGWTRLFDKLAGVIAERGGMTSHTATIARQKGVPALVGAKNAIAQLRKMNMREVTLDVYNQIVYEGNVETEKMPLNDILWRVPEAGRDYNRNEPSHFVDSKGKEWVRNRCILLEIFCVIFRTRGCLRSLSFSPGLTFRCS
ncbi:MAG: PEP/pyruvate-binding domain-containing protein [Candidatus Omnitrophota bacterium]